MSEDVVHHFVQESPVVILDFGSQFTQLIARSVRGLGVYCEIHPYHISHEELLAKQPKAVILSGGPSSVGKKSSPKVVKKLFESNLPILGICYGMQLISHVHKGKVKSSHSREYGFSELEILEASGLFKGFKKGEKAKVWMSHGDSVGDIPKEAILTARTKGCPVAAIQMGNLHAVQFHPEVAHTEIGERVIANFLFEICKLPKDWKMENFL